MADFTVKQLDDMQAAYGGGFVKARAELGVTSFGMQVIRLPPETTEYPEHDHEHDGQEEVYLAIGGSGWLDIEGERVDLAKDVLVRVGPGVKRKAYSGPEGIRMLVMGATPGQAYEVKAFSELTAA